ncbi:MAG: hypothetical protein J6S60_07585 [Oscillospiraceae bacterium]|nr:hypothetical protein [Oscillospiraceae bacterium]
MSDMNEKLKQRSCENCQACNRGTGCSGCQQNSALNPLESALLDVFSATPFLPVAIDRQSGQALLLDPELEPAAASLALRLLQRRGYVQVSTDLPLPNASYRGYEDWKHGSAALTARGQEALDAMEYGGQGQE